MAQHRFQRFDTTGLAAATVSSGVLECEGRESFIAIVVAAGAAAASYNVYAVLDDNTEVKIASGNTTVGGTSVIYQSNLLPRRIRFEAIGGGSSTARLIVHETRSQHLL